ncbi:MAG: hypothetical protein BSR46_16890 [Candidatus Dactylopiibacterium carminicum]|nr:MAG: hypothetical protein BSR46_16890 [Candidatus Dactylopiibacterium carminicum]
MLALSGACLISIPAFAATPAEARQQELKTLRDHIRSVQKEIAHGEEHQEEASDGLAVADKAISFAQARLRELTQQRTRIEGEIARLQSEQQALETRIARLRKQLGDAIYRLYVEGGQAGTRRLLSGDDPNQIARDAHYIEQIAKQRAAAIDEARAARVALDNVLAQAETKHAELKSLEASQRETQRSLQRERQRQSEVLHQISTQLRDQRRQIERLKNDETRIEKLLRGLERIARSTPRPTPPVTGVEPANRAVQGGGVFAAQRGNLPWPVKGSLTHRFGSPREEGLTQWRGIFLKATRNAEIHAVAAGRVAFSDWLRGFGNLVIIDHGDDYLSVYGNNEAIFKLAGDEVSAGEVIASAGSSGGQDESGLYFEIRHRGQPQDPSRWLTAK